MNLYLDSLAFAANTTLPIFILVLLGWLFRRIRLMDERFIETASRLVFTAALPTLIFINIVQLDVSQMVDSTQLLYGAATTVAAFLGLWWGANRWIAQREDQGVFVQGAFRGNLGIIGLALCANLYGSEGLAIGSLLLAVVTLLYNVLSVFVLTLSVQDAARIDWRRILHDLLRNPLIIAIAIALPLAWLEIRQPSIVMQTGVYFADLTLPLALLCVGGAINFKALHSTSRLSFHASFFKLLLIPGLQTAGAWALGLEGVVLGTLFLMCASPTATVSFIMVKAIGGNAKLAANIVAVSTLASIFSLSGGLFLLRFLGIL